MRVFCNTYSLGTRPLAYSSSSTYTESRVKKYHLKHHTTNTRTTTRRGEVGGYRDTILLGLIDSTHKRAEEENYPTEDRVTKTHKLYHKHNTTMIDILAGIATITLFASSHFCADEQIEETAANNDNNSSEKEGTADVIAAVSTSTSSGDSGDQDECSTTPNNTSSASHELANESTSNLPTNKLNNNITSNTTPSKPTNDNIIQHSGAEYVITTEYQEEDEDETQFTNNFRIPTICSTEIINDTVYGLVRYVTESCSSTPSTTEC